MTSEIPEGHFKCSKCGDVVALPGGSINELCVHCFEAYCDAEDDGRAHVNICCMCQNITMCDEHGTCYDCLNWLNGDN